MSDGHQSADMHELKLRLTLVKGYTELAERACSQPAYDQDRLRAWMGELFTQVNGLVDFVNELDSETVQRRTGKADPRQDNHDHFEGLE